MLICTSHEAASRAGTGAAWAAAADAADFLDGEDTGRAGAAGSAFGSSSSSAAADSGAGLAWAWDEEGIFMYVRVCVLVPDKNKIKSRQVCGSRERGELPRDLAGIPIIQLAVDFNGAIPWNSVK